MGHHSGFRNVVRNFTSHTVQKPHNQKRIKIPSDTKGRKRGGGNFASVHFVNPYKGSSGTVALMLSWDTRWGKLIILSPWPFNPLSVE